MLQVNADMYNDKTMLWFTHSAHGPVGVFSHLQQAICKDFAHVVKRQHGRIIIPNVLQFEFELVPNPLTTRKDHLLVETVPKEGEEEEEYVMYHRPQVFSHVLKVKLFRPDHKF